MLWIGGQITATAIIKGLLLPSLVSLFVPLIYLSFTMKGNIQTASVQSTKIESESNTYLARKHSMIMLITGLGMLLFVPIFKTITHLPPYMGVLLGLGIVWVVSEILHHGRDEAEKNLFLLLMH